MPQDPLLEQAIQAMHENDKRTARVLLTRLLKADPANMHYWLWMSASVSTSKEAIYCLQQALNCEPGNDIALRGLAIFGALKQEAPPEINPYGVQTNWETFLKKKFIPDTLPKKPKKPVPKNRMQVVYFAAAIAIIAGIVAMVSGYQWLGGVKAVEFRPTLLPSQKPSATYLSTKTPIGFVPSQTPTQPKSLSMLLEVPYTATPYYISTPHNSEAFQLAMRAYEAKNWNEFLEYARQVLETEKNPSDIYYYMGEAERAQGHNTSAKRYYDQAIRFNTQFAPAYLGKARNDLDLDAGAIVISNLNKAIDYDPNYGDAYLERGAYYIYHDLYDKGFRDLAKAQELIPENARVYHAFALGYLDKKDYGKAIEYALQAQKIDITILDNYRVIGEAYIAENRPDLGLPYLLTYVEYQPGSALANTLMGKVYNELNEPQKAMEYLNLALRNDSKYVDAYIQRGRAYLLSGNATKAVGELTTAFELRPKGYEVNFYRGIALLQYGRNEDARGAFTLAYLVAGSDFERGQVYHYRSIAAMRNEKMALARDDWNLITRLPPGTLPEEWVSEAQFYLDTCKAPRCPTPSPWPTKTLCSAPDCLTPTVTITPTPGSN